MSLVSQDSQKNQSSIPSKQLNAMYWTEQHDTLLCREILAVNPFDTKKGTPQRGEKWKSVADHLMLIKEPKFKVETRSVRDRYRLLSQRVKRKNNQEKQASGIETDMKEWEHAIEDLIEREQECDGKFNEDSEKKTKAKADERELAEGMRKRAMEKMGEKLDTNGDEKPKKRRSNGSDTLVYLREKNESMEKYKEIEMELKKKELEVQEKKHDDFMKMMVQHQQLQQQQTREFQTMMMAMLAKIGQK